MTWRIVWKVLVLGLICVGARAEPVHLFLLAGQSNMAGRGEVTPDRREPIAGVMALQSDGSWGPALDPLHWDKSIAGVGLARSFAKAYRRDHPGVTVGFIPAACGGSPISAWFPGEYFEGTQSLPYDDALARTKQALALSGGQLMGVLWHQGESDSRPERVHDYAQSLASVFARLRADLGKPDLPIITGQLGQFSGAEWSEAKHAIDAIQQEVAAADPRVEWVRSDGLGSLADLIHFNATALDEFGERYAAAWVKLEQNSK